MRWGPSERSDRFLPSGQDEWTRQQANLTLTRAQYRADALSAEEAQAKELEIAEREAEAQNMESDFDNLVGQAGAVDDDGFDDDDSDHSDESCVLLGRDFGDELDDQVLLGASRRDVVSFLFKLLAQLNQAACTHQRMRPFHKGGAVKRLFAAVVKRCVHAARLPHLACAPRSSAKGIPCWSWFLSHTQ